MLTKEVADIKACCPFCDSVDVKLYSTFGTAQLVRQFYCHSCRSAFEYIRWQDSKEE